MTRYSDFLQKISSAATPPNGRLVSPMDDIVERELLGRCLDESAIRSSTTFVNLIHRLFPSSSEVTPEELNKRYLHLLDQRQRVSNLKLARATPINTRYNLRSRTVLQSQSSKSKNTQPIEEGESKSKEKQSQPLYDTKTKQWNLGVFQPGAEALALERTILTYSSPPTVHTSPGILAGPVLDGPVPPGWNQATSRVSPQQDVADTVTTDPKDTDEDLTSSFEDASRRGAAYDGDSLRDKDYVEGKERKREQGETEKESVVSEIKWAAFLNAIAEAMSALPGEPPVKSSRERMWFGCFSSNRLPSEPGQVQWNRKPDLVLLADRRGSTDMVTWRNPKALGELTISDLQHNTTLTRSLKTKAYILLSSQPWRRYALAFSIAQDQLRVYLFDRSGVIISPPINIHKQVRETPESLDSWMLISFGQVEETCRIIHSFATADDDTLGFDPTLRIDALHFPSRPFPSTIGTVEIDGIHYNIISVLWTSNGFIGRCTNAFHVRPKGVPLHIVNGRLDEHDYVVKDSWLDEGLAGHEERIFHHISGVKGVPTLVKAWTVQNAGDDDSTLRHRPSRWDRQNLSPEYVTRIHRRLLMTPVGSPLSSFKSQREFLGGIITAVESTLFCSIHAYS